MSRCIDCKYFVAEYECSMQVQVIDKYGEELANEWLGMPETENSCFLFSRQSSLVKKMVKQAVDAIYSCKDKIIERLKK
jgi:hypothetical protein